MNGKDFDVVTGASGYTGNYITQRLLKRGREVVSLTGHPERHSPFGERVPAVKYRFDDFDELVDALRGARTLYNTYWIRFEHAGITFDQAVENSKMLFQAAKEAGVKRVVHVSIANPSLESPLPYYSGKARVERALIDSGLSYAILRPTVIFGLEDILINNIAYFLRRFPIFAVPGDGKYQIQPIYVEDMASLAVSLGENRSDTILDAVGPEIYNFNQLLDLLAKAVDSRGVIVHLPAMLALWLSQVLGLITRDVVLTRDEVRGLEQNLLVSDKPPSGTTSFKAWVWENREQLGSQYASELARHYRYGHKSAAV